MGCQYCKQSVWIFMSTKKSTKTARNKNKKAGNTAKKQNNNGSSSFRKGVTLGSTAASYEVSMRNPTYFNIKSGVTKEHSEYGPGIRVSGRQQLALVSTTAANSSLFAAGIATVTANYVFIAPFAMNDRIAQFSALYQRYVFRRLRFTYTTRVGTTQVGSAVLAYNSDSGSVYASTEVAPTYATCQDIQPCVVFPFRKETETLDMVYNGERTWMVAIDVNASATAESARQCTQGLLQGFPDVTSIGVTNMGEIFVDYELDLYGPTNINTNVTLSFNVEVKKLLILIAKKSKELDAEGRKVFGSRFKEVLVRLLSETL
jgi:hypothetical protein